MSEVRARAEGNRRGRVMEDRQSCLSGQTRLSVVHLTSMPPRIDECDGHACRDAMLHLFGIPICQPDAPMR